MQDDREGRRNGREEKKNEQAMKGKLIDNENQNIETARGETRAVTEV